jgi:imidazolonepropionase-like amidohydrolase
VAVVDGEHEADIVAHLGANVVSRTIVNGTLVG